MDTNKTKAIVIKKLIKAKGIVTDACKAANIARATFYLWYNSDEAFKQQVDDVQNISLDFVEGKLYELIEKGDATAVIFFLKTKGKRRGYIERADDQLPPVIITTTVSKEEVADIFKTINEQC
jgi:hypothetical protein